MARPMTLALAILLTAALPLPASAGPSGTAPSTSPVPDWSGYRIVHFSKDDHPSPASAQTPADCQLATWQSCPEIMIVEAIDPDPSGVGSFHFLSNQIVDISRYGTAQFLQTLVPPGTATKEWHSQEFDDIFVMLDGNSRVWWSNRDTGEKKSVVFDATRHAYQLIPRGVPHFIDQRAADRQVIGIEFLLSDEEGWTAQDFITHRVHVDEPFPLVLALDE